MTCPRCQGEIISVGRRAWCVRLYAEGGCGGFFALSGNAWRRQRWNDEVTEAMYGPGPYGPVAETQP